MFCLNQNQSENEKKKIEISEEKNFNYKNLLERNVETLLNINSLNS